MDIKQLMTDRAKLLGDARSLIEAAAAADRDFSADEQRSHDELIAKADRLQATIEREQALAQRENSLQGRGAAKPDAGAPAYLKSGRGDSEQRATAHYLRTGDVGALGRIEQRASNDTDMNVTTSADGGYAVPTGLADSITAKRSEMAIYKKIGVVDIPGIGTTVNAPVDNGTANEFVSTSEAGSFDRDAPVLGQKAMTLVLYSKKIQLSVQLLADEDAKLLDFVTNYVARALSFTENKLLVTEALASGTTSALGAAAAATVTDIPKLYYAMGDEYGDNLAWIMKRATQGAYMTLTGNNFQLAGTPPGSGPGLWGQPVYNSSAVPAIGTGLKSLILLNGNFVGRREGVLTFLRDPYSSAGTGQVNLWFYTRLVYKVLVADAVQYGTHP